MISVYIACELCEAGALSHILGPGTQYHAWHREQTHTMDEYTHKRLGASLCQGMSCPGEQLGQVRGDGAKNNTRQEGLRWSELSGEMMSKAGLLCFGFFEKGILLGLKHINFSLSSSWDVCH